MQPSTIPTPLVPDTYSITVGRLKLKLKLKLDAKDAFLLSFLQDSKFLTTTQFAKSVYDISKKFESSLRAVSRRLKRLSELKLIEVVKNRVVGGIGQGSTPYIWQLTKLGHAVVEKIKVINNVEDRKPYKLHKQTFMNHQIAVNEIRLRLEGIAKVYGHVRLGDVKIESDSWKYYRNQEGNLDSLRPDLYATTYRGNIKNHWFIEVDLNTERPIRVVKKCQDYLRYLTCTIPNDWCCGEFPAVLWIVPNKKRKESLMKHISENTPEIPDGQTLFIVITEEELEGLVAFGKLGQLEEVHYE